jgi:hypothetical protein
MLRPSFLLPEEDEKEYTELLVALENEYKPAGPTECFLVSEIAEAQCRLRRITSVEGDLLQATGARYLADAYAKACDHLGKLSRYESTLRRNWYRAVKELRTIQKEKQKASTARDELKPIPISKPVDDLKPIARPKPPAQSNAVNHSKPIDALTPVDPVQTRNQTKPIATANGRNHSKPIERANRSRPGSALMSENG